MSKFWCEDKEAYVDDYQCSRCNEEDCKRSGKGKVDEKFAELKKSELLETVKNHLATFLRLDEDNLDKMLNELAASIVNITNNQIRYTIETAVEAKVSEYVEEKLIGVLDKLFNEVLNEKAVFLMSDETAVTTKIHKIILDKMKAFFADKGKHRYDIRETLEGLIQKNAQDKVDAAIKEIKQESIDKFNKEVMKRLMKGMINEIAEDKRIIQLLET